jgi:hypothetical protein
MRLLWRRIQRLAPKMEAPAECRQSIEAPPSRSLSGALLVPVERGRHPGGVVEASDV